jgi:CTP:molybdopterin cytidylyltransferase MocA
MSDACVILAAGRGQRMAGRNKALLPLGGQTFLQTIAGACEAASIEEVVVVVAAPHLEETRAASERLGLRWVCNERPEDGMASSVARGFAFALEHFIADHCWLWPVDVPAVGTELLARLSAEGHSSSVVIPTHADRGGHPVLVGRALWSELTECQDAAEGARSVFRRDPERVIRVPVQSSGVGLDVDHPEDLARLTEELLS